MGGAERLVHLVNTTQAKAPGSAGEVVAPIVIRLNCEGNPVIAMQRLLDRTPYAVSFRSGNQTFMLLIVRKVTFHRFAIEHSSAGVICRRPRHPG